MECFVVYKDEIEGRLDPFYYKPSLFKVRRKIQKKYGLCFLKDFVEDVYRYPTFYNINYQKAGVRVIKGENINEDGLIDEDQNFDYIDINTHNKFKRTHLKKGDLVFTVRGIIGKVGFYNFDDEGNINANVIKIRIKKEHNPKFFWIYLNSKIGQTFIESLSSGQVQKTITVPDILKIPIPKLDLETQNTIVQLMENAYKIKKQKETEAQQLLNSINDYVLSELGIKLPELKDQMTFVVYADDVKGKRLDAYYYQPKFEEVEKAIENGKFGVRELKEITVNIKTGTTPHQKMNPFTKNEEIIFLRNSDLDKNKILLDNVNYVRKELEKQLIFSKKDELIICIAGTIGISAVNIFDFPIAINQNISSLELKEDVNPFYISSMLNLDIYLKYKFPRIASVATIFYINNANLLNLKIPLPPLEVQNKIAEEVKKRMKKAEQLQKEAKEVLVKTKQEVENIILNGEEHGN